MSGYIHPDYPRPGHHWPVARGGATIGAWSRGCGDHRHCHWPGWGTGETGDMESGVSGAGEKADTVTGERTKTRMGPGRGGGAMTGSAAGALQENRMTGRADCPADGSTLDTLDIQFRHRFTSILKIFKMHCRNLDTYLQRSSSIVGF